MGSPIVLSDYPQPIGNKRMSCWYHAGPASYAQLVTGTPPTGGDSVSDTEAGMRYLEFVIGGISDNGQYWVDPVPSVGNPSQPQPQAGTVGAPQRTWKLRWTVLATGAEVAGAVNLSGRTVRLFAIGTK